MKEYKNHKKEIVDLKSDDVKVPLIKPEHTAMVYDNTPEPKPRDCNITKKKCYQLTCYALQSCCGIER